MSKTCFNLLCRPIQERFRFHWDIEYQLLLNLGFLMGEEGTNKGKMREKERKRRRQGK